MAIEQFQFKMQRHLLYQDHIPFSTYRSVPDSFGMRDRFANKLRGNRASFANKDDSQCSSTMKEKPANNSHFKSVAGFEIAKRAASIVFII